MTTNSHHRFRKHKNLIADMEVTRTEQVFVSDITYIRNRERHMGLNLPLSLMKKVVKESVSTYNTKRPHFSCGYNTPEFMHKQCTLKIITYKKADKKTLSEASGSV